MVKEIELKFKVDDFSLIESQYEFGSPSYYYDMYYRHPCRDFLKTGEWLRVRTIRHVRAKEEVFITYKGPKSGVARTEIETEILRPVGHELLAAMGFKHLVMVSKQRRLTSAWTGEHYAIICLDEVDRLGKFVELELMGEKEDVTQYTETLYRLARELGLDREEKLGYAELMLQVEQSTRVSNPESPAYREPVGHE